MASPFGLNTYTTSEFVKLCLAAHDPALHEASAAHFESLRAMFEAVPDAEMEARFEGLRDEQQAFADAITSQRQEVLKLFLDDQGEDVPQGATVTVEKDAEGIPTALSW